MTPEERSERIKKAINEWAKLDADFITVLEKIVELRRSNPGKYNMAKTCYNIIARESGVNKMVREKSKK